MQEKITREDKKKVILGLIHSAFHMDVSQLDDEEVAELILKVCDLKCKKKK